MEFKTGPDAKEWHEVKEALTTKQFGFGSTKLKWSYYVKGKPEFEDIEVGNMDYSKIDLLIGQDMEELLLPLEEAENYRRDTKGPSLLSKQNWGGQLQGHWMPLPSQLTTTAMSLSSTTSR